MKTNWRKWIVALTLCVILSISFSLSGSWTSLLMFSSAWQIRNVNSSYGVRTMMFKCLHFCVWKTVSNKAERSQSFLNMEPHTAFLRGMAWLPSLSWHSAPHPRKELCWIWMETRCCQWEQQCGPTSLPRGGTGRGRDWIFSGMVAKL